MCGCNWQHFIFNPKRTLPKLTLPFERTRAVLETEKFLLRLCDSKVTPGLKKTIREQARALLRHYPRASDFALLRNGWDDKLVKFTVECPFDHPDRDF